MTEFNTSFKRAGALALLVSLSMSLMMPQGLAQTAIQQPQADPF